MNVGDTIKIKKDLACDKTYDKCWFRAGMKQYKGKTTKIEHKHAPNRYRLKIDGGRWNWSQEMFNRILLENATLSETITEVVRQLRGEQ